MEYGMYVMPPEATSAANLVSPSLLSSINTTTSQIVEVMISMLLEFLNR
jgi:hypothetical protein